MICIGWAEVRSPSIADGEHLTSNHSITVVNLDRWASFVSLSYRAIVLLPVNLYLPVVIYSYMVGMKDYGKKERYI